jgi:hypothetical protein
VRPLIMTTFECITCRLNKKQIIVVAINFIGMVF